MTKEQDESSSPHNRMSLLRGTSVVSSLTLVSRLLGFVRDLCIASVFGASLVADAFFVAFRLPNLLRSFVAEGALTSAFVPVFSSELHKGKEAARQTLRAVSSLLIQLTIALSILGIFFAPQIVSLIAPGFGADPEQFELCVLLTRIMFPYILFVSMVAMINGALNTVEIFGAAAVAQIVMNIVMIVAALIAGFFEINTAVIVLALSVPIGGLVQVLIQFPLLKSVSFLVLPALNAFIPATKEILKLMAPAILGAAVYQISIFLNTALASVLETGSVSWLFYADRIVQLPIGVFSIALASVLLPALSRSQAQGDLKAFEADLVNALRYTSFLIIPFAAGMFYYAEPIVRIIFERGNFTEHSTQMTSFAIKAFSFGIWAISCHTMIIRGFLARKDTKTPTVIGIITLSFSFSAAILMMGPPVKTDIGWLSGLVTGLQAHAAHLDIPVLGHVGLALASSLAALISISISAVLLGRTSNIEYSTFLEATLRSLICAGIMLSVLEVTSPYLSSDILKLVLGVPLGALVYVLVSFALKSTEAQETFSKIRRYIK